MPRCTSSSTRPSTNWTWSSATSGTRCSPGLSPPAVRTRRPGRDPTPPTRARSGPEAGGTASGGARTGPGPAARVGPRRDRRFAPWVAGGDAVDVQVVTEEACLRELGCLDRPEVRVVASGNFATPRRLLSLIDDALPSYRLFMLNAQGPLPDREGVIYETPFIGPGMRRAGRRCDYLPMRLSLVPHLFERSRPPDVVAVHTSLPVDGRVSLGIEVNILVAAIEYVRERGGLVVA